MANSNDKAPLELPRPATRNAFIPVMGEDYHVVMRRDRGFIEFEVVEGPAPDKARVLEFDPSDGK